MTVFSRKPSLESVLQKVYTEAYQSSLQSVLKESSFEYKDALEQWKLTLSQITSGMALLDGTPPRTGQEKSLLASIMDTERQCHDRIGALEKKLGHTAPSEGPYPAGASNPYGTSTGAAGASTTVLNVSDLSLNEKRRPTRVAVGSKSPSSSEPALAPQPHPESPVFDFSDKFVSSPAMPKVSDMPYKMYSKKPNPAPLGSPLAVPSAKPAPSARSAPVLSEKPKSGLFSKSSKEQQQPTHRSSLDYPQPAPANYGHSMLSTLRSKNPLKSRKQHTPSNSMSRSTPSPRTSAENVSSKDQLQSQALTAAKQTAAAQQMAQAQAHAHAQSTAAAQYEAQQAAAQRAESPVQFAGFEGAFRSDSQPTSPVMPSSMEFPDPDTRPSSPSQTLPRPPGKPGQFQVVHEKVSTSTGRTMYRPRVVRTQGGPVPYQQQPPTRSINSGTRPKSTAVLADGKPENDQSDKETDELDDWDRMVREKIKQLRGVDKQAAEQIVSEVVLKGDKVSWDDIAGLERAKGSLKETVVYPFLRPDLFMGLREPVLGMLLFGPPGTGKTMLARAVAAESKSTFFSISASSLTSKFMGESEKLVRALFQIAKALAPSIIFVDEIDSILTQRADSGEHEASRRIKNEFLVQWSDLQSAAAGKSNNEDVRRVLVLGATNLPWAIDEAARRRFVRRQYIPLPEPFTRRVHLEKLLSHQKHGLTSADIDDLVTMTDGYSGSDLTALAKDAAMGPLRSLGDALLTTAPDQIRPMNKSDFVESMKSIRPSVSPEGLHAFEQWANMYGSSGA